MVYLEGFKDNLENGFQPQLLISGNASAAGRGRDGRDEGGDLKRERPQTADGRL